MKKTFFAEYNTEQSYTDREAMKSRKQEEQQDVTEDQISPVVESDENVEQNTETTVDDNAPGDSVQEEELVTENSEAAADSNKNDADNIENENTSVSENENDETSTTPELLGHAESTLEPRKQKIAIPFIFGLGAVAAGVAAIQVSDNTAIGFLSNQELFAIISASSMSLALFFFFSSSVEVNSEEAEEQEHRPTDPDDIKVYDYSSNENETKDVPKEHHTESYIAALQKAEVESRKEARLRRDAEMKNENQDETIESMRKGEHPEIKEILARREQELAQEHVAKLEVEKKETKRVVDMYEEQLSQLRDTNLRLTEEVSEKNQEKETEQKNHTAVLSALKSEHARELTETQKRHAEQKEELEENSSAAVANAEQKTAHTQAALEEEREKNKAEIKRLAADNDQSLVEAEDRFQTLKSEKVRIQEKFEELETKFNTKVDEAQKEERDRLLITLDALNNSAKDDIESEAEREAVLAHGERLTAAVRRLHNRSTNMSIPAMNLPRTVPAEEIVTPDETAPEETAKPSKRKRGFFSK